MKPIRKLDHNATKVFRCCYVCHRVEFFPNGGTSWCWEKNRHEESKQSWDHERCYLKTLYDEPVSPRLIKR